MSSSETKSSVTWPLNPKLDNKGSLFTNINTIYDICVRVKMMVNIDNPQSDHNNKMNKDDLKVVLKIKEEMVVDLINPSESNLQTIN